jgi:hypothetical protein
MRIPHAPATRCRTGISTTRGSVRPAWTVLSVCFSAVLCMPLTATAAWLDMPPPLPAPSGRVVHVSSETQLQAAVAGLTSDTTIMIARGTYRLTKPLYVKGPLSNVTVRGASNHRADVVLIGEGRDVNGATPYGIWVGGDVKHLTIANLTVREVFYHPIIINYGPTAPRVYNVHLINGGQQLLKTNPGADTTMGVNGGVIEYSLFEYTPHSRDWYANAIQVLAGSNWVIRNNLIRNIKAPAGELAGVAVLAWFSASNTIIEGNTFINCQREIGLGLIQRSPNDHTGGIIRNNFIYRDSSLQTGDVAIGIFDSPDSKVLNNTILLNGTYKNAIEYRFSHTTGALIANNLTDAAIVSRDGGTATVQSNYTHATSNMFVNPATGDLHLTGAATAAIDRATANADVTSDWDGHPRAGGSAPDLGADERSQQPIPAPGAPSQVRIR